MGKQGLSDVKIKNLKPAEKPYKVFDGTGLGLYILVKPNGSKLWRIDYRYEGKYKTLSLGKYPVVSLSEARKKALEIKAMLERGEDPALNRKLQKDTKKSIFKEVAEEYIARNKKIWAYSHYSKLEGRLRNYIYPKIGSIPISEIKVQNILSCIQPLIDQKKIETARRVLQLIGQVLRYAIITGRAENDPTPALRQVVPSSPERHFSAVTEPEKLAGILKAIWNYHGNIIVASALKVLVYTFQRPGEIVSMKWEDVNLEKREWRFFVSKIKKEHIVPLSHQVVEILKQMKELPVKSEFVFPSLVSKKRHITVETLRAALLRIGINTSEEQSPHGFRAVARTLLHEKLGYEPDVIELQLSHTVPDRLGEAYNRAKFLEKRKQMMQDWADYIDSLVSS